MILMGCLKGGRWDFVGEFAGEGQNDLTPADCAAIQRKTLEFVALKLRNTERRIVWYWDREQAAAALVSVGGAGDGANGGR